MGLTTVYALITLHIILLRRCLHVHAEGYIQNVQVNVLPPGHVVLQEGTMQTVSGNVSLMEPFKAKGAYVLRAISDEDAVARLQELRQIVLPQQVGHKFFKLGIIGVRLGKTNIRFYVTNRKGERLGTLKHWVTFTLHVNVLRNVTIPTTHVNVISHAIVAINLIMVGTKIDREEALSLIKRPMSLTVGFICRFGILPGTVILLSDLFKLDAEASSGLLGLAVLQGGGASVLYVLLMDGDLSLSLMMTFLFGVAGLGFAPLWFLVKQTFLPSSDTQVHLPYLGTSCFLAVSLTLVVVGIVIRRYYPRFTEKCHKCRIPIALASLTAALMVEFVGHMYVFRMTPAKNAQVAAIFVLCSCTISAGLGLIVRRPCREIIAIAAETGINTSAITSLLLAQSMKQPDVDIAQTAAIVTGLISQSPALLASYVYRVFLLCKNNKHEQLPPRKTVTFTEPDDVSETFLESDGQEDTCTPTQDGSIHGSIHSVPSMEVVDTKETNV